MEINNKYIAPIQEANSIWQKAFGDGQSGQQGSFHFTPDNVIRCFEEIRPKQLKYNKLDDWIAFENDFISWDHYDFFTILVLDSMFDKELVFLITDEGLKDQIVFKFHLSEFEKFVEWYELKYSMDFFQPADYILFDRSVKSLVILHHEGMLIQSTPGQGFEK